MSEESVSLRLKAVSARITNLLAGSWAVLAFYLVARSLLVTHEWVACFAAPVPLLAVWATLERKRWGRLTLLGISLTSIGLFLIAIGLAACLSGHGYPPAHYALLVLHLYVRNPANSLSVMLLALATGLWMRRAIVVADFEQNKRAVLTQGQNAIAGALVVFWALTVLFAPLAARDRLNTIPATFGPLVDHQVSSRSSMTLSVQRLNSR